jgi:hypothetical protein
MVLMIDEKTKELLKTGKAKMEARLKIVKEYFTGKSIKSKSKSSDLLKAGFAKKKTRTKVVEEYLKKLNQPF